MILAKLSRTYSQQNLLDWMVILALLQRVAPKFVCLYFNLFLTLICPCRHSLLHGNKQPLLCSTIMQDLHFAPNDKLIVKMKMVAGRGNLQFKVGSESQQGPSIYCSHRMCKKWDKGKVHAEISVINLVDLEPETCTQTNIDDKKNLLCSWTYVHYRNINVWINFWVFKSSQQWRCHMWTSGFWYHVVF